MLVAVTGLRRASRRISTTTIKTEASTRVLSSGLVIELRPAAGGAAFPAGGKPALSARGPPRALDASARGPGVA